jgi:glycosyltransferase involved in cell wall biosynthesis
LIIVNDGSKDDTSDVVKKFQDSRIVYLEHRSNRGLNAARNTGINKARGTLIAFLDDDDELSDSALEKVVETYLNLNNDRVKMLIFNCVDSETGKVSGTSLGKRMIIRFQDILCRKLEGDHWMVVDRDILPKNGVFDEKAVGGAMPLWIRLLRNCDAYYSPDILYYAYRMHGKERNTHLNFKLKNSDKYEYFFSEFLEEFGTDMKSCCPMTYAKYSGDLAFWQIVNSNFRSARIQLLRSFRVHFSLNNLTLFLLSFFRNKKIVLSVYQLKQIFLP